MTVEQVLQSAGVILADARTVNAIWQRVDKEVKPAKPTDKEEDVTETPRSRKFWTYIMAKAARNVKLAEAAAAETAES